jgi:hypothetical protein
MECCPGVRAGLCGVRGEGREFMQPVGGGVREGRGRLQPRVNCTGQLARTHPSGQAVGV